MQDMVPWSIQRATDVPNAKLRKMQQNTHRLVQLIKGPKPDVLRPSSCTACALRGHCVCTACILHTAEAGILTQEYLSPDWLHNEATKPT